MVRVRCLVDIPAGVLRVCAIVASVVGAALLADSRALAQPAMSWSAAAPLNTNAATDTGADLRPDVATDGAENWVAVWHSSDTLGGTIGGDSDILVARSSNNGVTWTTPAPLNTNAASDTGTDLHAQVATDGDGTWLAVWSSNENLDDAIGTDYDILFARSTDNGSTWTDPAPLNTNAAIDSGDDSRPQLATDGAGNWVAVWQSSDNLGGTTVGTAGALVARSSDNGLTWSAPAPLNNNATTVSRSDRRPYVATDGTGTWLAVWDSTDTLGGTIGSSRDILFAQSTDNGETWTDPAALDPNAVDEDVDAHVATDGADNWVAVWSMEDDDTSYSDVFVSRSSDNGDTWTPRAPLNSGGTTDSDDYSPRVTTDAAGAWVAVWESNDTLGDTIGSDADILFARSTDNGATWSQAAPLNSNASNLTGDDETPSVVTDGVGNWLAVWQSNDDLGGTIGQDFDILFARSTDGGETWFWDDPAALNTNATTDTGTDQNPDVATDGAGIWVAVWQSSENLGGNIGTDEDIFFARSTDGGRTWTDPEPLNTNAATDSGSDFQPRIATGGDTWIAVWTSNDSLDDTIGTDADILFARSTNGGITWTDPAPLNSTAAASAAHDQSPHLATDGNGNWVAVWYSDDTLGGTIGSDPDILFARSTDDGLTWSDAAPLNTNAAVSTGDDRDPYVITDGAGTWVVAWESSDDLAGTIGMDYDILYARSTDAGVTWTDPAPLNNNAATDSGDDHAVTLATDGATWIAAWSSDDDLGGTINPDWDIHFVRSTDGGITWSDPAPLNTNAIIDSGVNFGSYLATDAAGNWVAVWSSSDTLGDTLGTDADILFARSFDDGATWSDPAPANTNATTDSGEDFNPRVATDGAGNWIAVWQSNDSLGDTIGSDWDILFAWGCALTDTDDDGLSDCDEVLVYGTDPYNPDTSGDGYTDGEKVSLGTDPLDYCAIMRADVDHDGIVTIIDLSLVAGAFGQPTPPGDTRLDQDDDGLITIIDLSLQAGAFGQPVTTCP